MPAPFHYKLSDQFKPYKKWEALDRASLLDVVVDYEWDLKHAQSEARRNKESATFRGYIIAYLITLFIVTRYDYGLFADQRYETITLFLVVALAFIIPNWGFWRYPEKEESKEDE